MLKVVSILMIVFGAIATVFSLIGLIVVIAAVAITGQVLALVAYLILVGGGIAQFVVGIIGAVNHKDLSKAQMLFTCGIVVIAVQLLANILSMVSDGFNVFNLISGLLFPILFTVGANQMKNGPTQG